MDGLKLIASIMETGSVETLRKVDAALFLDDERPVFDFVKRHYRRYAQLPAFNTVEEETGVRLPEIEEQTQYYLKRIFDRKLYGDLTPQFSSLRDSLRNNNMDEAREHIAAMRMLARQNTSDEDIRNLSQAGQSVLRAYEESAARPGVSGVPTGWETLDNITGGYQPGDLVSWIGRMGMGKTYILLSQADYAWQQGYNVLVVTMEMTITQIARRHAGMLAGINPEYIRKGQLSVWARRRLRRQLEDMHFAERFNIYAGGFSKHVEDIEVVAQEFDPDIIFIDGVYLLRPSTSRNMHRLERIAEVLDEVKKMTITQNRPIVTTSQFSRQAGKKGKEGSLETIGFTDAIGMHSSLVFGIKEGAPPHQSSRRQIEIMKGREGEHGEFAINYKFTPINFGEIPPETQQAEAVNLDWMGED